MKILVLNSGSSSLKYQLINSETEDVLAKGIAERIGVVGGKGRIKHESSINGFHEVNVDMEDHDSAMDQVFMLLTCPDRGALKSVAEISAVGHRVVHGGEKFAKPVLVDDKIIAEIDKMSELAPLHNPPNLKGIQACKRIMPTVPQVAVFDTAFHATMPDYAYTYALPYEYYMDFGVRRYGFHGTSHQYVSNIAMKMLAESGIDRDESRLITCHDNRRR
ncbi:MAG: acetate kinase, partial [Armatimonadota bacterium]